MEALLSTLVDPYADHERHRYSEDFYPGDDEEEYASTHDFEGRRIMD